MSDLTATCHTCDATVLVDQCDDALLVYKHVCRAGSRVHVRGLVRGSNVTQRSAEPDLVKSIGEVRA